MCFLRHPLYLFPAGSQPRACLVISMVGFLKVCPIHRHAFPSYDITPRFVLWSSPQFYVSNFVDPLNAKYPPQAFVNQCLNFGYSVRIWSPYSELYCTDLTLESGSLVWSLKFLDIQIFFIIRNALRAFCILAFTSSSVPPVPADWLYCKGKSFSWSAGSSWATTGGDAAPPLHPLSCCPSHLGPSWWVFLREHASNVLSICGSFSSWPSFALRWLPKTKL